MNYLAAAIRHKRIQAGISQVQMAAALHIGRQAYVAIERGNTPAAEKHLAHIARILGCSSRHIQEIAEALANEDLQRYTAQRLKLNQLEQQSKELALRIGRNREAIANLSNHIH